MCSYFRDKERMEHLAFRTFCILYTKTPVCSWELFLQSPRALMHMTIVSHSLTKECEDALPWVLEGPRQKKSKSKFIISTTILTPPPVMMMIKINIH